MAIQLGVNDNGGAIDLGFVEMDKKLGPWGLSFFRMDNTLKVLYFTTPFDRVEFNRQILELDIEDKMWEEVECELLAWVKNRKYWKDTQTRLYVSSERLYNFDLERRLLELGFKGAEVHHATTNMVEAQALYCYRDENGVFKYDGVLNIDYGGTAFLTLKWVEKWISNHPEFVPTKNRLD